MIETLSSWAKNIILAVIIISILEMILPNNKLKKYVKMVMGIYLLFNIISPMIKNKELFDISNFDINSYQDEYISETMSEEVDQTSMDKRLREIYIDELEKDIKTKLENKGYVVNECNVDAQISNDTQSSGITRIVLNIEKEKTEETNLKEEEKSTKENEEENEETEKSGDTLENRIVTEIQKIKTVEIGSNEETKESQKESKTNTKDENKLESYDIREIKNFLIEEYGVNEKCLKIN